MARIRGSNKSAQGQFILPQSDPNTFRADAQPTKEQFDLIKLSNQKRVNPASSLSQPQTQSLKKIRKATDDIRNEVMHKVSTMGLNVPRLWKDELFQNELTKLDIKREIQNDKNLKNTLRDSKGPYDFNLEQYELRYFDKKHIQKNFNNFKKVMFEENRSQYSRMK